MFPLSLVDVVMVWGRGGGQDLGRQGSRSGPTIPSGGRDPCRPNCRPVYPAFHHQHHHIRHLAFFPGPPFSRGSSAPSTSCCSLSGEGTAVCSRPEAHEEQWSPNGQDLAKTGRHQALGNRKQNKKSKLTSSACFPPSYRTNNTLTFSRCVVSRRIEPMPLLRASPSPMPMLLSRTAAAAPVLFPPGSSGCCRFAWYVRAVPWRAREPAKREAREEEEEARGRAKSREGGGRGSTILSVLVSVF